MNTPTTKKVFEIVEDVYSDRAQLNDRITDDVIAEYDWDENEETCWWPDYCDSIKVVIDFCWVKSYNHMPNLRTATLLRCDKTGFAIKFEWRGETMPKANDNTPLSRNKA